MKYLLAFLLPTLLSAYDMYGPLEPCSWYVLPKIGAAPGLFANRGHELRVVPRSGIQCPLECAQVCEDQTIINCSDIITYPDHILQQDCCRIPTFSALFTNRVLHVGGEVGYISGSHGMYFIDLLYNRAAGNCVPIQTKNIKALDGCCLDTCNGNELTTDQRTDQLDAFSAFGAYVGNRYFFNRILCERFSFFLGLKIGVMHRREVHACSTYPELTDDQEEILFNQRTLTNTIFCSSNAVSGGIQVGFDIDVSNAINIIAGFEAVATSPFKSNRNIPHMIPSTVSTGTDPIQTPFPTNIIVARTGSFIQFPIWIGLRWQWGVCCP